MHTYMYIDVALHCDNECTIIVDNTVTCNDYHCSVATIDMKPNRELRSITHMLIVHTLYNYRPITLWHHGVCVALALGHGMHSMEGNWMELHTFAMGKIYRAGPPSLLICKKHGHQFSFLLLLHHVELLNRISFCWLPSRYSNYDQARALHCAILHSEVLQ